MFEEKHYFFLQKAFVGLKKSTTFASENKKETAILPQNNSKNKSYESKEIF